jgi:hypothetical protein
VTVHQQSAAWHRPIKPIFAAVPFVASWHKTDITIVLSYVRFWGKADIDWAHSNVRF